MSLFRPEALEAQQVSALGRILLFTPRIADVLIALVPVSGVIKVYPPQGGRIEAVEVQSGARVTKGAVLTMRNPIYRLTA